MIVTRIPDPHWLGSLDKDQGWTLFHGAYQVPAPELGRKKRVIPLRRRAWGGASADQPLDREILQGSSYPLAILALVSALDLDEGEYDFWSMTGTVLCLGGGAPQVIIPQQASFHRMRRALRDGAALLERSAIFETA